MKKGTKKTLLIGGGILGALVIAAVLYYFLVYKKDTEKEDTPEEDKPQDLSPELNATFLEANSIAAENAANTGANMKLQNLMRELKSSEGIRRRNAVLSNGGSMNKNALDNQIMRDNAKKIKEETGIDVYVKPKPVNTGSGDLGNTVFLA